jgi:hypothetical protein
MDEKEIKTQEQNNKKDQPAPRTWVKPNFERLSLEKATAGTFPGNVDGGNYNS